MTKNYAVRLKCPHGDADESLILRNRNETVEQVQTTTWHFECPVHGVQQEIPVEVREINSVFSPKVRPMRIASARMLKAQRRTKRIPLRVPVLVYGRTKRVGAFHEDTFTSIVNAHGGLISSLPRLRSVKRCLGGGNALVRPNAIREPGSP
jgi:hypothetical protein